LKPKKNCGCGQVLQRCNTMGRLKRNARTCICPTLIKQKIKEGRRLHLGSKPLVAFGNKTYKLNLKN
jgi:hypothetical protein